MAVERHRKGEREVCGTGAFSGCRPAPIPYFPSPESMQRRFERQVSPVGCQEGRRRLCRRNRDSDRHRRHDPVLSKITGDFDGLFAIFFGKDGVTIGN